MRRLTVLLLISLAVTACNGGGGSGSASQTLSTEELLQQCLGSEISDLSTLLTTLQGILDPNGSGPVPQFNIIQAVLTGKLPWTLDLDGDAVADLSGEIFLTDTNGAVMPPPAAVIQIFATGGQVDLDAVLAALPDGTKLNLAFEFTDLALVHGASGDGTFVAEVQAHAIADVSGGGTFSSGDCDFDFDVDGLSPEILNGGGLGEGSVGFGVGSGTNSASGSIELDGSNTAQVTARRPGQPDEHFVVDLTTGLVQPA